jgi:hypothetical protein
MRIQVKNTGKMCALYRRLTASSAAAELPALYRLLETWSI